MKKTVSILLLIVVCCVFAPLNALAADNSHSANHDGSAVDEIISRNESMMESIHADKIADKASRAAGSVPEVSRKISPPSEESNRFTIGWIVALMGLVGAGVGVYIYNRRKKK